MSPTKDGRGLILSYLKSLYSFKCNSPNQCYWEETGSKVFKDLKWFKHMMMNVPSILIGQCDCVLDSSGDCQCPTGVTGPNCEKCQEGFWGLREDQSCTSESNYGSLRIAKSQNKCFTAQFLFHTKIKITNQNVLPTTEILMLRLK